MDFVFLPILTLALVVLNHLDLFRSGIPERRNLVKNQTQKKKNRKKKNSDRHQNSSSDSLRQVTLSSQYNSL